ncbi:site-specific integrase [Ferrimonas aestuarii]|uniref:site-specific integrase n=1 Tax=Ferrimonas aestuarii TaxID=2569539 RepID=UPI00145CA436|nr:site-specific integrase [Ferrimonas aestuarii]
MRKSSEHSARRDTSYLIQSRHGIWYARIVVPKDSPLRNSRSELRRSLKTRCYREAIQRSWSVLAQLTEQVREGALNNRLESIPSSRFVQTQLVSNQPSESRCDSNTALVSGSNSQESGPLISEVISMFINEKLFADAWGKHEDTYSKKTYSHFVEVVGDLPLSDINGALLKWAKPHYGCDNPTEGLTIAQKRKVSELRKSLSDDRVRQLFAVTKQETAKGIAPFKCWLPYLGAYTGARIAELAQLYVDDVKIVDGIPCIHFREGRPDQSLKSLSCARIIPIHSKLIELGFLKFVEQKYQTGKTRLFEEIPSGNPRGYGHKPSLWFTKVRNKMRWGDGESFHSLRHTVITKLKRNGVSVDLVAGLVGHSHGSVTFDRYGKEYRPKDLVAVLEQLTNEPSRKP